jgi:WD40 repeat protein
VGSIAYSTDGRRIVTGSADASARIWDAETGESLRRLNNDGLPVSGVAISDDGRFVATTGRGLAVWDADTGRQLLRIPGFDSVVDFAPDGKSLALVGPGTKTLSVIDCDVCVDNVDSLLALADERITREPSASERNEYLDR